MLTIAGLEDLGYVVNYAAADQYGANNLAPACKCPNGQLNGEHTESTSFLGNVSSPSPFHHGVNRLGAPRPTDMENQWNDRKLRQSTGDAELSTRKRRKLSDSGYAKAFAFGKRILLENRLRMVNVTLPDGVAYVGDKFISVLYLEDGEVYTVEVTGYGLS